MGKLTRGKCEAMGRREREWLKKASADPGAGMVNVERTVKGRRGFILWQAFGSVFIDDEQAAALCRVFRQRRSVAKLLDKRD